MPERELRSGFAEVVKHGLIADADYFEKVSSKGLKQENWNAVIAHSIHIKDAVVKEDPKERGLRKILNFGHTIGHAIESYYLHTENRLLHGEAIAIGIVLESYLSKDYNGLSQLALDDIKSTIKYIFNILGFNFLKNQKQKNTDEDLINFFKKYGIEFNNIDDSINKFIAKRENLRKKKEYKAADEMRESILELGISIEDGTENGWSWKNN